MRHREADGLAGHRAVAQFPVILNPSGVRCVLVKVARRDVVMLATDHAAKA